MPSAPPANAAQTRTQGLLPLVMLGILVVAALRIWVYFAPAYYAGVDEASYFLTAKALATTLSPAIHSPDPLLFVPAYMVEVEPGVFYQKYPIGYPLLLAGGYLLGGPTGAFLVNPVMGVLCILGTMLLARDLFGPWPAVVAGACLALCPAIIFQSVGALSHISDACFVVFGLWMLWRWLRVGRWRYSLAAGLLLGFALSIRNTEAVLVAVVAWAALLRYRHIAPPGRLRRLTLQILPMAVGFVIAITPLALFQWRAFGSPFRSGYSFTGESTAFGLDTFVQHLPSLLTMLNTDPFGLPVLLPAALLGLLLWCIGLAMRFPAATRQVSPVVFLLLWIAPTLLLYTAYYWSSPHATIYLRLFISTFPAVIIAAAATADALTRGRLLARITFHGVLLASSFWMIFAAEPQQLNRTTLAWFSESAASTAREALPEGSLLVADKMSAFAAVFATNHQIITPLMFDAAEIQQRQQIAQGPPPHELNAVRAQRYLPLVAGKSQEQLDDLLRQLILQHLEKGQRVGLLTPDLEETEGSTPRRELWSRRLAPTLSLRELQRGQASWVVYEITKAP